MDVDEPFPMHDEARHEPCHRVRELARRHGFNATAFQTLDAGYAYFFAGDGCVAYVDTGRAWVAAGAPLAATGDLGAIARAFVSAAAQAGRRCCFFATEDRFVSATSGELGSLRIGEQPAWEPARWDVTLARHARLREQIRRGRAKGVTVRRVTPRELRVGALAAATSELIERWRETRGMPPMKFLVRVEPRTRSDDRTCVVAERGGKLVGLAGVLPVPERRGWFVEQLIRAPDAPNGTAEVLVDEVMRWAATEERQWLTLGLAPLAGDVALPLRIARQQMAFLYDFGGLRGFKAKLRPHEWRAIHVSYPTSQGATATMLDVLRAFAGSSIVQFGARTVMHRWKSALA